MVLYRAIPCRTVLYRVAVEKRHKRHTDLVLDSKILASILLFMIYSHRKEFFILYVAQGIFLTTAIFDVNEKWKLKGKEKFF